MSEQNHPQNHPENKIEPSLPSWSATYCDGLLFAGTREPRQMEWYRQNLMRFIEPGTTLAPMFLDEIVRPDDPPPRPHSYRPRSSRPQA